MAAKGDSIGSRLVKGGSESFESWCDRIKRAHISVLGRILPSYQIIESVPSGEGSYRPLFMGAIWV